MPPGLPKLIGLAFRRSSFVTSASGLPVASAATSRWGSWPAFRASASRDRRPNWPITPCARVTISIAA
jgi:hypothetical protein